MPDRTFRRSPIVIAVLMLAFSIMSYFNRTIVSIATPQIISEFALSETQMGSIHSAFLLSYGLLMIPGGYLADRIGPSLVLTWMSLGSALFTGLTALAGRPGLGAYLGIVPSFLLVRLGMGTFTAPLYPSCGRVNANWFSAEQRARIWGLVASGAGVGGAMSPFLFAWMMHRYGWRASFWLAAAATAVLGLLWLWYAQDHPSQRRWTWHDQVQQTGSHVSWKPANAGRNPWRRLLSNRSLMWLTLGYSAVGYFEYIFFFWIYYYFAKIRQVGDELSALFTTILFLMWMVMTPLGGWIFDRMVARYGKNRGRRLVPTACLTISAVLLCIGVNMTGTWSVALFLAFALGFASASDGPFWATAIDLGGKDVGAAGGIMNTGANLGGFVAPTLTPLIASIAGWSWSLYFASLVVLIGVVCWFLVNADQEKTAVPSPQLEIPTAQP
jgi:sugar phosphate permease